MLFSNDADTKDEPIIAGAVPPIIAPSLRGECVVNTEMQKKSIYLTSKKNNTPGACFEGIFCSSISCKTELIADVGGMTKY